MQVLWVVSMYVHEQRTTHAWDEVCAIVDRWDGGGQVDASLPFLRSAVLVDRNQAETLVAALRQVDGAVVHLDRSQRLEPADFAVADLVAVFAGPQESDVVTNADEVLAPTGPCPRCGLQDAFDVAQSGPLALRSDQVVGDVVNLPGGGLAVSRRVLDALSGIGARGGRVQPVLDARTGDVLAGWGQLVSDRVALLPCPIHTSLRGAPWCPACGRAHGGVEGLTWFPRSRAGGADVLSRHPGGHAMLHLSRRAVDALAAAGAQGIEPADVVMLCDD